MGLSLLPELMELPVLLQLQELSIFMLAAMISTDNSFTLVSVTRLSKKDPDGSPQLQHRPRHHKTVTKYQHHMSTHTPLEATLDTRIHMPMDITSILHHLGEDKTSDQTKTKITNNDQNTIMMDT